MLPTLPFDTTLLYLGLTLATYAIALEINRRSGKASFANPVLLSVCFLIIFLLWAKIDYQDYFSGAQPIHLMLGPVTVALAVPLFRHRQKLRQAAVPLLAGLICGSVAGIIVTVAICLVFGMEESLTASLSTKSITAPVALGIAEQIGGTPPLAAVFAVMTGILGGAFGPALLTKFRVHNSLARGLAMGVASHGQGTARILEESEEAGAIASLGMGITALVMAILLPLLARFALQ